MVQTATICGTYTEIKATHLIALTSSWFLARELHDLNADIPRFDSICSDSYARGHQDVLY